MPSLEDLPVLDELPVANLSPDDLIPVWDQSTRTIRKVRVDTFSTDSEAAAGADAKIAAAALTPAQIMSKAGEQLIASLQVTRPANAGTAHFATTRATSGTFQVGTSTGYARLINADGTLGTQAGTGVAGNSITLTIPASGLHRALGVLSVANGSNVRSGDIISLDLSNDHQLTTFSGTGLSSLASLGLYNNQLTTFSGTGLSLLASLDLSNNQLTTFSGTGLSLLESLYLSNNQLTTFSGTGLPSLAILNLSGNQLTTFSGTGLSLLESLNLSGNQLGTVGVSGLANLEAVNVSNNLMGAVALDAFYTSLETSPGVLSFWYYPGIYVTGNSGTAGDDPSIATARGHTVYGS